MKSKHIASIAVAGTATLGTLANYCMPKPVTEPTLNVEPSVDEEQPSWEEHSMSHQARLATAHHTSSTLDTLLASGMESGTAGMHMLRPVDDPGFVLAGVKTAYGITGSLHYSFWHCSKAESQPYYPGTVPFLTAQASYERILQRRDMDTARTVLDSTTGEYLVEIELKQGAVDLLDTMMQVTNPPALDYHDWYGIYRDPGEPSTEMFASLVADDAAYPPISLTNVVETNAVGVPLTVASGLTQSQANDLLTRLGF